MTSSGGRAPLQGPERPRGSGESSRPRAVNPGSSDSLPAPSVPPSSDDPLRDALVSSRRYGATLNGLLSAIDSFSRGVEASRNANDALCRKLEGAEELAQARRAAELRRGDLELRVEHLEQKLRAQREAFAQERRFLTEEQDEFLRALLEEHEDQMGALRREVAVLRSERESSRSLIDRMRTQRDQAQAALDRALRKSSEDAASPTTPAPPPFAAGARLRVPPAPRTPSELADGLPDGALDLAAAGSRAGKDGAPR